MENAEKMENMEMFSGSPLRYKYLDCAFGAENICISSLGAKAAFCGSLRQVNKTNQEE